jgi:cytochrome c2
MRKILRPRLYALLAAFVATVAVATPNDDVARGREVFKRCEGCHSTQRGQHLFGPSLAGIVGRPAGKLKGYAFSDALASQKFTWTPERLARWVGDEPKNMVPGTRMEFPGISDEAEVRQLISYLHTLKP